MQRIWRGKAEQGEAKVSLQGRDLISITDFSQSEIMRVLDVAEQMAEAIGFEGGARAPLEALDAILATLFFEPSTRTRLSFETAMLRLGGQIIGFAEPSYSSIAKGESLADTARIVSAYADIIVIRHPLAGAAKVAADYADKPVINAGDGPREHPTQTLTDLFTLRREFGRFAGLKVGLCGDLKYGRTVHSLAPLLAQWGAEIVCIAPEALCMPESVLQSIRRTGREAAQTEDLAAVLPELDVLYMTRIQKERFPSEEAYEAVRGAYGLTPELMESAKEEMRVLHPLPRVDEIHPGVDVDRRAAYFRQAAGGVPVRMALIALLLGIYGEQEGLETPPPREILPAEIRCQNPQCITSTEIYLAPQCYIQGEQCLCAYCDMAISH